MESMNPVSREKKVLTFHEMLWYYPVQGLLYLNSVSCEIVYHADKNSLSRVPRNPIGRPLFSHQQLKYIIAQSMEK